MLLQDDGRKQLQTLDSGFTCGSSELFSKSRTVPLPYQSFGNLPL